MYFGGVIVAANSGSVAYLLDGGKCGHLYKPKDELGLFKCMDRLMRTEKESDQIKQSARLWMIENFIWEHFFEQVENSFYSILNGITKIPLSIILICKRHSGK